MMDENRWNPHSSGAVSRRAFFSIAGVASTMLAAKDVIAATTPVSKSPFGKTSSGDSIDLYTLANSHAMQATIMNYGGIVVSLRTPDRTGHVDDIVLGFDKLDGYLGA